MTVVDIDSLSRLLRLQEEERRRVAIELHDELGQMYAAVQFKLAFVRDRVGDEALAAQIAEAIELVRDAADSVRDVALD
ncbi:MAG TPA: histidine kinase, partial [Thermoanaerobaculia bacterium]|nr:histidine kinase [Thermoanaerobaculia bacterium]